MNDAKYIGLDVNQETSWVAVLDSAGKLAMEAVLETKAETILQFLHGLRGSLQVTLEEGTCAAWLHDLPKPHVANVLYLNKLNPVYHGETAIRALREVARSYLALTRDSTRVMNRLKALYRG